MPKTYCSNFTVRLKLAELINLDVIGSLLGIHATPPKDSITSLAGPNGEDLKQMYVPVSLLSKEVIPTNQLLNRGDCTIINKQQNDEEGTTEKIVLNKDHLKGIAESSLPKNVMQLTVHNKREVESVMYPAKDGQSYVIYPKEDVDNLQHYQLLVSAIDNSDLAFCSMVNLQGHEGLFRLETWRGRLVIIKQAFPENLVEHTEPMESEFGNALDKKLIIKAIKGFGKLIEPIGAEDYRDRIKNAKIVLKSNTEDIKIIEDKKSLSGLEALLENL